MLLMQRWTAQQACLEVFTGRGIMCPEGQVTILTKLWAQGVWGASGGPHRQESRREMKLDQHQSFKTKQIPETP